MEKRLFLTGPFGCGKTRLLTQGLGASLASAGGYVMRAEYGARGELAGFTLSPAAAAAGVAGFEAERFLDCTRFPPVSDNEVLRGTGSRLLGEALWYPFALLDELGGYELLIPEFRAALYALLRSGLPLIGALKTHDEADALRRALGLGDKWRRYREELDRLLALDLDCRVVDLAAEPAEAEAAVREWARDRA